MELYYAIIFFVFGTIFGSFFNVVGSRLPKGESILFPGSHCDRCNHSLKPWELIPIVSFLFQRGKCSSCKQKLSWFHPIFECVSGLTFMFAYLSFGFTWQLLIALTFISMILIVVLTDYYYMIILDEILILFLIALAIEFLFIYGIMAVLKGLLAGLIALIIMFLIKKLGDFMFKRESMGGGDIKLMFLFGFVLGWPMAILSIFIGSIVGLPIALLLSKKSTDHEIPFGPFLSIGALVILLSGLNLEMIVHWMQGH